MDPLLAVIAVVLLLFAYLIGGFWIFAGMLLVSATSLTVMLGYPLDRVGAIMRGVLWRSATTWELAALPLFIWMGEMMFQTDISARLFRGLSPIVDRLPGRLLHTNVLGCTIFAAVCGSSTATTATVGKITLAALRERHYDTDLTIGSLAGAGSLGLMIPPSIIMIVYGVLGEVSIARLFAAGFLPGFLLAALYSLYIGARCVVSPSFAPAEGARAGLREMLAGLAQLQPIALLVLIVLGGIYSGLVTPSECAAIGVIATLAICYATRQLSWAMLVSSLMGAVRVTSMICVIVIAAALLSTTVGYLHIPGEVSRFIAEQQLSPYALILVLSLFYILLGCFLDGISMTVMTLPVVLPLVTSAGFDPVWFGVYLVIMVELAQITPPVGFNLYVIQGLTGHSIGRVAHASLPFFALMSVGTVLIVLFPGIALWLPDLLYGK